ncbi:hypothetical protein [Nannocystis punicea]|uniref:Dickkopf N-terminal cysteine-rich domain-containing protein n=1 Tax=Nannocystis punicea TaxID=2995304 RepID=A0ABY7HHN3_9BACT|nr:hypothetical protein [Nannocystis poenicansa]WAS98832.1 hypothetical protein O0S08_22100 [Nannocystis poenicansa]
MRRFLLVAILVGCGDSSGGTDGNTGSTGPTSDASATGPTTGPGLMKCAGDGDCPTGLKCIDTWCQECGDHADCTEDEYCWAGACKPKRELGEPCEALEKGCKSGVCGLVGDEPTCVTPCEYEEEPTPPAGPFVFPPYECSPGFLCVRGGWGTDWYCWPENSGDYKMPGETCAQDPTDWDQPSTDCVTLWCGDEGKCAWNCKPRKADPLSEWPCPEGQQCVETFSSMGAPGGPCIDMDINNPFDHYSVQCECRP